MHTSPPSKELGRSRLRSRQDLHQFEKSLILAIYGPNCPKWAEEPFPTYMDLRGGWFDFRMNYGKLRRAGFCNYLIQNVLAGFDAPGRYAGEIFLWALGESPHRCGLS